MRFDTVIFDLDGTLLYTLEGLHNSVNHALRTHGLPELTLAETRRFVGNGSRKLIERAIKGAAADFEAVHESYCDHYTAHAAEGTRPYEGIPEMLDALKAAGIQTAVVSNKPDPRAVWEAMEKLGADKGRTLYVGDSDTDFFTAENAGIPCALVSWGYRDLDELEGCGALAVVHSVAELATLIEKE